MGIDIHGQLCVFDWEENVLGTNGYMAPELVSKSLEAPNVFSDLYSAGLVLKELAEKVEENVNLSNMYGNLLAEIPTNRRFPKSIDVEDHEASSDIKLSTPSESSLSLPVDLTLASIRKPLPEESLTEGRAKRQCLRPERESSNSRIKLVKETAVKMEEIEESEIHNGYSEFSLNDARALPLACHPIQFLLLFAMKYTFQSIWILSGHYNFQTRSS